MSNELMKMDERGLVLGSLAEIKEVAGLIAASGLAPKDMDRAEKIVVAILFGKELGLPPMASLQNIAVINGRPCIWGDAMLGIVEGTGALEDIEETLSGEGESMTATCTVTRRGRRPHTQAFSMADAKRAGLAGKAGPWTQYPKRMLALRARAFALRNTFSDALKGIPVAEEVRDAPRDVTAEGYDYTTSTVTPAPTPEPLGKEKSREVLLAALLECARVREMDGAALAEFLADNDLPEIAAMSGRQLGKARSLLQQCYPEGPARATDAPQAEAPEPVELPDMTGVSYWTHPKLKEVYDPLSDHNKLAACTFCLESRPTMNALITECRRLQNGGA